MRNANENLPQRPSGASAPLFEGQRQATLPATYTTAVARAEAMACRSVGVAIAAPTIRQLEKHCGSGAVGIELMAIVEKGMELFGQHRRMNAAQIGLFAEEIQSRYPHESLADIALFMRGASMGIYGKKGQEGETFGALDPQRMFVWFREYLEEKAIAREQDAVSVDKSHEGTFNALANLPDFTDLLKSVRAEGKAQREESRDGRRLALLKETVRFMHDDDLRNAYKFNRDAPARSIIIAEAIKRGLLGEEFRTEPISPQNEEKPPAVPVENHPAA